MKISGLKDRIVFCFWTDDNPMPDNRVRNLEIIRNSIGCELRLVTKADLGDYILDDAPFHEAYLYLSPTQKSDYLRCYFMHHYGGGYCDIKKIDTDWNIYFQRLEDNAEKWAIGYREVGEDGVAILPGEFGVELKRNWRLLIGNGAYIFKPYTLLTQEWIDNLHQLLDDKLPLLKKYPAQFPRDCLGAMYQGKATGYPITWSGVGGSIVHPLCLKYADRLLQGLPLPAFTDYL